MRADPARRDDRSTPATPIWENPSARAQARSCASSDGPSTDELPDPSADCRNARTPALARRGGLRRARRSARRAPRHLRDAFIELQGTSAPARRPSCATCCARSASRAASRARPTRWWSRYELPRRRLAIWHFDFYRFDDPREWEDAGFRDVFAEPGPEARRMAREGGRPAARARPAHRASTLRDGRASARAHASSARTRRSAGSCCHDDAPAAATRCARWARWCCCWARASSPRRHHRRGARLAGDRLHARHDRVRRARSSRSHFLVDDPPRLVDRHRRPRAEPGAARAGRQGARRRSVHRRRARRPEPAARRAPGHRPEAGRPRRRCSRSRRWPPTSTGWCSTCYPTQRARSAARR